MTAEAHTSTRASVTQDHERANLSAIVSVRLDPEVAGALRDIANERGVTVSDLLRAGAISAANEPNVMRVEWITPPQQVSSDGRSATFDARSSSAPTADDLRALLAAIDATIEDAQGIVRLQMRVRRVVAALLDFADIDARYEAQDAAAAAVNARAGGAS